MKSILKLSYLSFFFSVLMYNIYFFTRTNILTNLQNSLFFEDYIKCFTNNIIIHNIILNSVYITLILFIISSSYFFIKKHEYYAYKKVITHHLVSTIFIILVSFTFISLDYSQVYNYLLILYTVLPSLLLSFFICSIIYFKLGGKKYA